VYWRSDTRSASILIGVISFLLSQQPFYKEIDEGYLKIVLLMAAFSIASLSYCFIEVPVRIYLNERWAN
jgi:hypothetical protein